MAPDPIFALPRLAAVYDALDPDRSDLDAYVGLVAELGARRVLDIGCGTGTFALLLAAHGVEVVGVDPAAASVEVARAKPGADRVRWVVGEAADALPLLVDLAVMTANVAQVFVADEAWATVLADAHAALRPGGHLVFEARVPADRAWERWTPSATRHRVEVPGVGPVEAWCEVLAVAEPLVTFRWSFRFAADGAVLTSDSTLRFRPEAEMRSSLDDAGFLVRDVRDAPDRPGREMVVVAHRPG